LSLVRERYPDMLLCVASNGLEVELHVAELAKLNVSHVTLTVNAVDPAIGARIYAWVRAGYRVLRGEEAAAELLERQRSAIAALKSNGLTVKINTIIIPGVNDQHIGAVAREMAPLGANVMNCIPLYPVERTPFASLGALDNAKISAIREDAATVLPQMLHCTRCRADAAGLLGERQSNELVELLRATAGGPANPGDKRPYFAVASREGLLINEHLGEADTFWIYEPGNPGCTSRLVEKRDAPEPGGGSTRWYELADVLQDCSAIFVNAAGQTPKRVLERHGVRVLEASGLAADAVDTYVRTGGLPRSMKPVFQGCGRGCAGSGTGCG
jgi:nitrogen fixation protein NifB